MNSEKVETCHGIIISPTQHMQKSRDGYDKNWTHFVYKLDNLFRSIRVRTKTHLLQRPALHFSRLFCGQYAPFKATSSTLNPFLHNLDGVIISKCIIQSHIINFQPFLTSFVIFHAFTNYFELQDPKIEKHYK